MDEYKVNCLNCGSVFEMERWPQEPDDFVCQICYADRGQDYEWTKELSEYLRLKSDELNDICKKDWDKIQIDCPFNFQPERLSEEARKGCDSPNTPTKGGEPSRND